MANWNQAFQNLFSGVQEAGKGLPDILTQLYNMKRQTKLDTQEEAYREKMFGLNERRVGLAENQAQQEEAYRERMFGLNERRVGLDENQAQTRQMQDMYNRLSKTPLTDIGVAGANYGNTAEDWPTAVQMAHFGRPYSSFSAGGSGGGGSNQVAFGDWLLKNFGKEFTEDYYNRHVAPNEERQAFELMKLFGGKQDYDKNLFPVDDVVDRLSQLLNYLNKGNTAGTNPFEAENLSGGGGQPGITGNLFGGSPILNENVKPWRQTSQSLASGRDLPGLGIDNKKGGPLIDKSIIPQDNLPKVNADVKKQFNSKEEALKDLESKKDKMAPDRYNYWIRVISNTYGE